jgi:hypothetical protein
VIPCKYDKVKSLDNDGIASVKLNGKWGNIDKTGKEVTPFKYRNSLSAAYAAGVYKYNEQKKQDKKKQQ